MYFFMFISVLIISVQSQNDTNILNPEGCGKRLNDFPNKIVGGSKAAVGDWAWQVAVSYNNRQGCGGSLINSQWVLTAAHCVDELYFNHLYFSVNLGLTDRLTPNPWSLSRKVIKIISHKNYSPITDINDIALMKLESPVSYSKYILPACIPTVADVDYTGQTSWSTGWGAIKFGGQLNRDLLEVSLPVLSDDICFNKYRLPDKRTGFCAGETGANMDTCQGDSGGPLVVRANNGLNRGNWTLAGITSYGRGCGDGGVVTRVSNYYNWILSNIN